MLYGGISEARGLRYVIKSLNLPDYKLILCGQFGEPCFYDELKKFNEWKQVEYWEE